MRVDVNGWSRMAEVDAYAAWRGIDTGRAVEELVNHALSDARVMPAAVRARALAEAHQRKTAGVPHAWGLCDVCGSGAHTSAQHASGSVPR